VFPGAALKRLSLGTGAFMPAAHKAVASRTYSCCSACSLPGSNCTGGTGRAPWDRSAGMTAGPGPMLAKELLESLGALAPDRFRIHACLVPLVLLSLSARMPCVANGLASIVAEAAGADNATQRRTVPCLERR
jgi:hypothetical protein